MTEPEAATQKGGEGSHTPRRFSLPRLPSLSDPSAGIWAGSRSQRYLTLQFHYTPPVWLR